MFLVLSSWFANVFPTKNQEPRTKNGLRFAVLGSPESWYLRDLQRAAVDREEIISVPFDRLTARLACGFASAAHTAKPQAAENVSIENHDLATFDAVLVRTMAPGSLEQVVFRMDALARLEALGVTIVNPPKAVEAAVDKFLTSAKLQAAGLATPRTIVCQSTDDAMAAFAALGNDVVVKPLFGSEGRGITRLQDEALALRAFRMLEQLGAVLYLQEFIPHTGHDLRVLVIGRKVLGMRRTNHDDWRTNCSRGAVAAPLELTDELVEMARRATGAVGASLAGVDFLPDQNGKLWTIEVNAVPGWKALAKAVNVDVARLVLDHVSELIQGRRR
jgi:ribosomal protein S6--L-glutamate ligase